MDNKQQTWSENQSEQKEQKTQHTQKQRMLVLIDRRTVKRTGRKTKIKVLNNNERKKKKKKKTNENRRSWYACV